MATGKGRACSFAEPDLGALTCALALCCGRWLVRQAQLAQPGSGHKEEQNRSLGSAGLMHATRGPTPSNRCVREDAVESLQQAVTPSNALSVGSLRIDTSAMGVHFGAGHHDQGEQGGLHVALLAVSPFTLKELAWLTTK